LSKITLLLFGKGALKERDDRDDEIARLKSKVGEITMDNQLLYAKIEALEGKRPLAHEVYQGLSFAAIGHM
jgi:hypothetical protein